MGGRGVLLARTGGHCSHLSNPVPWSRLQGSPAALEKGCPEHARYTPFSAEGPRQPEGTSPAHTAVSGRLPLLTLWKEPRTYRIFLNGTHSPQQFMMLISFPSVPPTGRELSKGRVLIRYLVTECINE